MDWFSPENVIAIASALVGLLTPIVGAVYQLRTNRGKQIGYRVQMDTVVHGSLSGAANENAGEEETEGEGDRERERESEREREADGESRREDEHGHEGEGEGEGEGQARRSDPGSAPSAPDADRETLVLLRIENTGRGGILPSDYNPFPVEPHASSSRPAAAPGLRVVFTGRTVLGLEVIVEPNVLDNNPRLLGPIPRAGDTIEVPPVRMGADEYFKLLVRLKGAGSGVRVEGGVAAKEVELTKSMSVDDKPPLFSRQSLATTAILAACLFVLAGIIIFQQPTPKGCTRGELKVVGSTAFAPAVKKLAHQYEAECPGAEITVDARGSNEGIRELVDADGAPKQGSPALLALSDGPKPAAYTQLTEDKVAVLAFVLVVNDYVSVTNLTLDQVRAIYRGDIVNWTQVGGPDLPVRLISRDASSGTRDLLRRRLLDGQGEPSFTSSDCVNRNSPQDKVIRCELGSTEEVLKTVARVPGAIGYSEVRAAGAAAATGLHALNIDGHVPSAASIGRDAYRFTDVEYAYTNGVPAPGSLASGFLDHVIRGSGQDLLRDFGHVPCYSPDGLKRCAS